jgi:plastocyanin
MIRCERVRTAAAVALCLGCAAVAVGINWQALAARELLVSQKGRAFQPNEVALARGDTLVILNDDGELLHHAFIRAERMNFDSGEQEPGTSVRIRFTQGGTFTVNCAIHPRMRLAVTVR